MTLLVIIPALNEEQTIGDVIRGIPDAIPRVSARAVLVVDDGSTDATARVARAAGAAVISHGRNRGVGAAFQTGLREALRRGADIIVHIDADGQFNPADIPTLARPVLDGAADISMCTRFSDPRRSPEMPAIKLWGNRIVRCIINLATGQSFTDVSNGFRAYSREAALRLTLFGTFTYTHEVLFDAALKGLRIVEVPLPVRGQRAHGSSRVAKNVVVYGLQWLAIFFRAFRDASPLHVFGALSAFITGAGAIAGLFVFVHWLNTGQTFPYRSLITVSGVLVLLGAFLFALALIADMLRRQRMLIEELLYHLRKTAYDGDHAGDD